MLEELGRPYSIEFVDFMAGAHKAEAFRAKNPMGKLPTLEDGTTVVTESAAIALYLADRYALGRLAPALNAPERATYLRWILYAPSVIEPGAYAQHAGWDFRPSSAGWGDYETMLSTIEQAITPGPFLLGDTFSMADAVFGGTLRYMTQFKLLEPRPAFTEYIDRLVARPAYQRSQAINAKSIAEHGLGG
jgi:glutathione S-transferase